MSETVANSRRSEDFLFPNRLVTELLLERIEVFKQLHYLREKGWNNPKGDEFFRRQREQADNADEFLKRAFFQMMQNIALDMNTKTGAFSQLGCHGGGPKVLDICIAPGGFASTILKLHRTARVFGLSLDPEKGGHNLLIPLSSRLQVEFWDVTLLSSEMGITDIPADHPDFRNFITARPYESISFDLVICDGQVLRSHDRPSYRQDIESKRLQLSQLVLALQRIRPGGTLVMLLHKPEAFDTLSLLYTFSNFSQIQLYKPDRYHAKRSSFYMIAKNVDPVSIHAAEALYMWKKSWKLATFPSAGEEDKITEADVHEVLDRFGDEFIQMAEPVWDTQRKALQKANFCKD